VLACTLGEEREDSLGVGERKTGRAEKEERVREVRKREEGSKGGPHAGRYRCDRSDNWFLYLNMHLFECSQRGMHDTCFQCVSIGRNKQL